MEEQILLVPIGPVPAQLLSWLAERLAATTGRAVAVGEPVPLPQAAYNPHRRQYLGNLLLAELRAGSYPTAGRVLGLTDADCYAQGLNFIFGQATMNGREAFVALPRLRMSFYGRPEDQELFYERTLKEAVHELGHTWGLSHCADPRCVMHFSNTLHDTDVKGSDYCPHCSGQLGHKPHNREDPLYPGPA